MPDEAKRLDLSMPATPPTVSELLLAQASSSRPGLCFEDRRWSWQEHVSECARYAAALRARRSPDRPFQVGVLADNVPEFSFLLGGCAFAGAVLVALNPVRRGTALAKDVARTDRWNTSDPVWWRPDGRGRSPAYVLLDAEQATALDAEISARLDRPI